MKEIKDVLSDLMAGKDVDCCGSCKYFTFSNKPLNKNGEGRCSKLKEDDFVFDWNVCEDYELIEDHTEIQKVYTKEFILKTINEIAEKNNIKIVFSKNDDEDLKNRAWSSGNEIGFNYFDNLEYMFIAFFHEYAHIKLKDKIPFRVKEYDWNYTSSMQFEIQVTMAGLNFAQELGFIFSDNAVKWLLNENFSYGLDSNTLYGILKIKDDKESYELKQCFDIDKSLEKNK